MTIDVNILTPDPATFLNSTQAISITGGAYAQSLIDDVQIYVNGGLIDTIVPPLATTTLLWSTSWSPPVLGSVYTITAVINSGVTSDMDEVEITAWAGPVAPEVTPTISNSLDIELDWQYAVENCRYAVYQSEVPYFTADSSTIIAWGLDSNNLTYFFESVVVSGAEWFYLVEGYNCGGEAAVSNETGFFEMDIYGGS